MKKQSGDQWADCLDTRKSCGNKTLALFGSPFATTAANKAEEIQTRRELRPGLLRVFEVPRLSGCVGRLRPEMDD